MELIGKDFLAFVTQVRRTMVSVAEELTSAKARDDLECALRILTVAEAEFTYLSASESLMVAQLDEVEALLAPLMRAGDLPGLQDGLERIGALQGLGTSLRLSERRNLLQDQLPAIAALADAGKGGAAAALDAILANESRQFEQISAARQAREVAAAPVTSELPVSRTGAAPIEASTLQAYLRVTFPDEPTLAVAKVDRVPGGRSKETTMITLKGVTAMPQRIVMRSDIPGGLVPSRTADEYAVIAIAERHGVPVPKPLHCEPDVGPLGRSFILVSAIEGATEGEYFPELGSGVQDKRGIGRQLAQILARINSIPVSELAGTHIDTSIDLVSLVRETIQTTCDQARSFDNPSRIHIEMAYRWLMKNLHLASDVPCLIHCDVGLHNIMIKDGRITAMLDWELATLASPAREISKIFHLIDYLMPREEFFAHYLEAGGPVSAVDPERLNFYAVMNYMVTNQRARFANRLFVSGEQRNIVLANAGYDSYYRNTALLANALQHVSQCQNG